MGLLSWVADLLSKGEYDSEEDFCNQNGYNYDDIYNYDDDSDSDW